MRVNTINQLYTEREVNEARADAVRVAMPYQVPRGWDVIEGTDVPMHQMTTDALQAMSNPASPTWTEDFEACVDAINELERREDLIETPAKLWNRQSRARFRNA